MSKHELDISRRKLLPGFVTAGFAAEGAGRATMPAYLSDTVEFDRGSYAEQCRNNGENEAPSEVPQ